jgi:hypothetical protein
MKGLYLYCIRPHSVAKSHKLKAGLRGIDNKSKVTGIPYKDIEAIVSAVDLKEYNSKELAQHAKEDIGWIIKNAKRHENVVEAAMGIKSKDRKFNTIIPMKFGMIFEKPQNLEDILKKEYQKFKKLLARLTGKQEWSVKVYAKELALREKLKSSEKKVQKQIKRAKALPRGADYFGELEVKKELSNVMQKKIDELNRKFFKSLSALESCRNKNLAEEFAGHKEPMILNSAYFISEDDVDGFINEAQELQKANPEFIFEYTGPWPPYNFVT